MRTFRTRHIASFTTLALAATLLAACGSEEPTSEATTRDGAGHYPVTIENCGDEVTFEAEPTNVVMLKSAWVPYLDTLGVLDHVSAKAGAYPEGYYDGDTAEQVDGIETLTDRLDASGHLLISKEVVVEREPDLVLGHVDNLGREPLAEVGIPMLEVGGLCPTDPIKPSFDAIYDELEAFGQVVPAQSGGLPGGLGAGPGPGRGGKLFLGRDRRAVGAGLQFGVGAGHRDRVAAHLEHLHVVPAVADADGLFRRAVEVREHLEDRGALRDTGQRDLTVRAAGQRHAAGDHVEPVAEIALRPIDTVGALAHEDRLRHGVEVGTASDEFGGGRAQSDGTHRPWRADLRW